MANSTEQANSRALTMAVNAGYSSVKYKGKFEDWSCFLPVKEQKGVAVVGYPPFILANSSSARFATPDERLSIMGLAGILD